MPGMGAVQTWVINLDRAPDRLARVCEQLERLRLPWQRLHIKLLRVR